MRNNFFLLPRIYGTQNSSAISPLPRFGTIFAHNDVCMRYIYEKRVLISNDPYRQAVHGFIRENGRPPVVLDIGCGTGLLSMLAVRAGALEVYGCELYEPLAQIAREVTSLNCGDSIKASFFFVCLLLDDPRPSPTTFSTKCVGCCQRRVGGMDAFDVVEWPVPCRASRFRLLVHECLVPDLLCDRFNGA